MINLCANWLFTDGMDVGLQRNFPTVSNHAIVSTTNAVTGRAKFASIIQKYRYINEASKKQAFGSRFSSTLLLNMVEFKLSPPTIRQSEVCATALRASPAVAAEASESVELTDAKLQNELGTKPTQTLEVSVAIQASLHQPKQVPAGKLGRMLSHCMEFL